MATIRDVAKRAGVSTATVSHVLNNTRFVSEETRATVLQAIRELNYHPSAIARSLSTRKTQTIGMVVSDITNIFFGEMIRGVIDVITPYDYSLLLCTTGESPTREEEYLQLLFSRRVDGFIAAATSQKWAPLQLVEAVQIPTVFVDRTFEGMNGPFVGVDNEGGAYQAVSHLIQDGHERIGIVAGLARMSTMQERLQGYKRALRDHSIPLDEQLVLFGELSVEGGRRCTLELLNAIKPPTAIFLNNNLLTLGALLAIKQLGWKYPQDVALVGFDDHPWASIASPALTTVRQPVYEIGCTAANMLMKMLAGESIIEERVLLKTELIVRESCKVGPHE